MSDKNLWPGQMPSEYQKQLSARLDIRRAENGSENIDDYFESSREATPNPDANELAGLVVRVRLCPPMQDSLSSPHLSTRLPANPTAYEGLLAKAVVGGVVGEVGRKALGGNQDRPKNQGGTAGGGGDLGMAQGNYR